MKERRVSSPFVSALRTIMEVFISLCLVAANCLISWQPRLLIWQVQHCRRRLSPVGSSVESRGSRWGCWSEIQIRKLSVSRRADVCQWAAPYKNPWFIMCINDSLSAWDCTILLYSQFVVVSLCLSYINLRSSLQATVTGGLGQGIGPKCLSSFSF